jgi:hypothetical protein
MGRLLAQRFIRLAKIAFFEDCRDYAHSFWRGSFVERPFRRFFLSSTLLRR